MKLLEKIYILIALAACLLSLSVILSVLRASTRELQAMSASLDGEKIRFPSFERWNTIVDDVAQCNVFKKTLADVDKTYNRASNNCLDHAVALQDKLRAIGIESSIFVNENRNHAWLAVWIEATNGSFIDPAKNNLHPIEVRSDRFNVVCADPVKSKVPVSTSSFPALWWK